MEQAAIPCPPPVALPGGGELCFDRRTLVMGILNVTDDSFSGDGLGADSMSAVEQAARFVADGADILDIGGESTRPGSEPVSMQQELDRVMPVVTALRATLDVPLSVDTSKPEVAREALCAGAHMINDINGLRADGMIEVAAQFGAPVVIMHMQGEPRTMQVAPHYDDVVGDINAWLMGRIEDCIAGGIPESQIIIDPGFGFGKTVNHNLEMLRRLREFAGLGRPMLMGTSRKSTIGKVLDLPVEERVFGTAATCAVAIHNGANVIRVHDVAEMVQVARMTDAILRGWPGE